MFPNIAPKKRHRFMHRKVLHSIKLCLSLEPASICLDRKNGVLGLLHSKQCCGAVGFQGFFSQIRVIFICSDHLCSYSFRAMDPSEKKKTISTSGLWFRLPVQRSGLLLFRLLGPWLMGLILSSRKLMRILVRCCVSI